MELILFIFISCAALALFHIRNIKKYKETSYYKITNNSYSSLGEDKGKLGEYLTYMNLRTFEFDGGKFLFNIRIPKNGTETTEIDLILICTRGILVFESKNYSGWIFGNEINKNWTQTFPVGRGRSHKVKFYNPIMQNAGHIRYLKRIIGDNMRINSIIVFSDECTLKDISLQSSNVYVVQRRQVFCTVQKIFFESEANFLSQNEIDDIYIKLYAFSQN